MKILQIHKYYSKERGAGSVTAFFETLGLLEKKGEQLMVFSMKDESNFESEYGDFFAEHFDVEKAESFWQKMKIAPKTIWNRSAQKQLEKLIKKEKPDVAHVHNIYHYLTPAIIHTLKRHKIPVVFKLSDYKAICPNYKLFTKGEICERCKKHKYYNCFLHNCLKNSRGVSFVGMVEAYVHWAAGSYQKADLFLAPSEFMKRKCAEFGIPEEKMRILRNVVNMENVNIPDEYQEEDYLLSYGRISEEKGIDCLLEAFKRMSSKNPEFQTKLIIAGKGPQEEELKKMAEELKISDKVDFCGFKNWDEIQQLVKKSKGVILSSIWYDNSPLVISEAQLLGKPMVVSDSGGSKEMILDGESGFIYQAESVEDLEEKISKLLGTSESTRKEMGEKGRENIKKLNNEENYYNKLMGIYKEAIRKNQ